MHAPIDWLVFDLGGVLIEVMPAQTLIAELAAASATAQERVAVLLRERFTERPFSPAERFQTGEMDEAHFYDALNHGLEIPLDSETLSAGLTAMLRGEKADTAALLRRLAAHYWLACYSNTNANHWRLIRRFAFFNCFEKAFASQELGFAKPDRRGFAAVAAALAAAPEACLLIDDRPANIAGAHAAGWQALLFTDCAALERDLEALGIATGAAV